MPEFGPPLPRIQVHFIHALQWYRIVPHLSKVRGWTISPSHFLNQQLDGVWLAE